MKLLADQIMEEVMNTAEWIRQVPTDVFLKKPSQQKWSRQQILGHLVDSAQNNLQRLVRAQYQDAPRIVYDQDAWVTISDYQGYEKEELVSLWIALNRHYAHLLKAMPDVNKTRLSDIGQKESQVLSLEAIADDYLKHMLHHIAQVKDNTR